MNHPARKTRNEGGFTLVEIMVVIVIIGLIATLVVPNVIGQSEQARLTMAQTNCRAIHDAAKSVTVRTGRVPELDDLVNPDDNGRIEIESEIIDPWGNEYVLRQLDGRLRFEVYSYGPDGIEDTEDDIVHPKRRDDY